MKRSGLITYYTLIFGYGWGVGLLFAVFNPWMVRTFGAVSLWNPLIFLTVWCSTFFALFIALVFDGMEGLRELLRRIFRWRFALRWYFISTIGIAAIALGARFVQSAVTKSAAPLLLDFSLWPSLIWYGLSMFIIDPGPLGEDPGWRGFALPRMLNEFNPTVAAILLGLIWAIWHLPAFLFSGMPQSGLPLHWFILAMVSLTVLMSWASIGTKGAVIPAILMHWSFNRFSDLSHAGAFYAAMAYSTAAVIVVIATRSTLGRNASQSVEIPTS